MKKTKAKRALAARASLRDVAAYLLDRADQYETSSGCWLALTEVAHKVMSGEIAAAKRNGDLDTSLYARVDAWRPFSVEAPAAPLSRGREGKAR